MASWRQATDERDRLHREYDGVLARVVNVTGGENGWGVEVRDGRQTEQRPEVVPAADAGRWITRDAAALDLHYGPSSLV